MAYSSCPQEQIRHRREFLKFLIGSPYFAAISGALGAGAAAIAAEVPPSDDVITSPKEALDVMDFEEAARRKVPVAHWAYMYSGVDDDMTRNINHEAYKHIQLRPRRLRDATKVDTKIELLGTTYNSPIFLCPVGGQKSFHPEGEVAVARAAKARGTMQMLSTATSTGVEEVSQALGRPLWYQLYAPDKWEPLEKLVRRVEAAGCPAIALTVDNTTGRNSETFMRMRRGDKRDCSMCHVGEPGSNIAERAMFRGIDMTGARMTNPAMTWEFVDRLKKATALKVFIKGIDTHEDARLCLEHGLDGIIVSNHGGRATETDRATIQALPEIVEEVRGKIPVFVDGGIRRGTDVFKALALGATAVGIGRPYIWGLGAFGQAGVDRVIEILQGELRLVMGNCGTPKVADITRDYVTSTDLRI